MREAIQLFREEGTVDDLGLGRIRDALSDRFFPGTSVLWRRARYLLIVPWVIDALEHGKGSPGESEERSRRLFRKIASELKDPRGGAPVEGVIGGRVADAVQTPDIALWAGLEKWGIRTAPGSLVQARRDAVAKSLSKISVLEDVEPHSSIWHPRLPVSPTDFPAGLSFELTKPEADFLFALMTDPEMSAGNWTQSRADSLFPVLLNAKADNSLAGCGAPWDLPASVLKLASRELREAVHSAGCFSDIARGAQLYYAYLVAESRVTDESSEKVDELASQLDEWADKINSGGRLEQLAAWSEELSDFWLLVHGVNGHVVSTEQTFIEDWARLCISQSGDLRGTDDSRTLIIRREIAVKRGRARLKMDGSIGRDAPAAVPQQMVFRWNFARDVALDIRKGLQQ